jgi:hypothetical protein
MERPTGAKKACSHLANCELFPKFAMKAALKVWQVYYCEGQFESCARYKLALEARPVPQTLLPNGKELAPQLIPWLGLRAREA